MNIHKFLMATVLVIAVSTPALAASQTHNAPSMKPFKEAKAELLKLMKSRQACVEAAENEKTMEACIQPKKPSNSGHPAEMLPKVKQPPTVTTKP